MNFLGTRQPPCFGLSTKLSTRSGQMGGSSLLDSDPPFLVRFEGTPKRKAEAIFEASPTKRHTQMLTAVLPSAVPARLRIACPVFFPRPPESLHPSSRLQSSACQLHEVPRPSTDTSRFRNTSHLGGLLLQAADLFLLPVLRRHLAHIWVKAMDRKTPAARSSSISSATA